MSPSAFLRLIRFPNLVIVVFTQYVIQYFILIPALEKTQLSPALPFFQFSLLVLSTLFIAASGYIINDVIDMKIDQLNKPHKIIIGRLISPTKAMKLYWAMVTIGFLNSIYLAIYIHDLGQLLIYPLAIFLLWTYSAYFKKSVLFGNLIVSIFCAFVAGIVLYAERENFRHLAEKNSLLGNNIWNITINYMIFAFLTTLFREIIKDIEDIEGDTKTGCKTLPIVAGIKQSKAIAGGIGLWFLYFILELHSKDLNQNAWTHLLVSFLLITLPTIIALILLIKASTKNDFHRLSLLTKGIMLSGLIYLVISNLT
jgi:4-hydroxybenzoate polyprenyltransferase